MSDQEHFKRRGEYICAACIDAGRRSPKRKSDEKKVRHCAVCGARVRRNECHKNRYGEYICLTCHGQGKRCSRQKTLQRMARQWAARLVYVALAVVGLCAAYVILVKVIQGITPSAN